MRGSTCRRLLMLKICKEVSWKMDQEAKVQDMPATLKQIGYLYRLGVREIPEDLSRDEASNWIDELVEDRAPR